MKKHDWALYTLSLGFALWAVVMFLGRLIPPATDGVKLVELALSGAAAFGTLAAVIVALVLAGLQARREARRQAALGRIAAARLLSALERVQHHLHMLASVFHHSFDDVAKHSVAMKLLDQGSQAWARLDGFDHHPLLGLSEVHTVALVLVVERHRDIKMEVTLFDNGGFERLPAEVQRGMIEDWSSRADRADRDLGIIIDSMKQAVGL